MRHEFVSAKYPFSLDQAKGRRLRFGRADQREQLIEAVAGWHKEPLPGPYGAHDSWSDLRE